MVDRMADQLLDWAAAISTAKCAGSISDDVARANRRSPAFRERLRGHKNSGRGGIRAPKWFYLRFSISISDPALCRARVPETPKLSSLRPCSTNRATPQAQNVAALRLPATALEDASPAVASAENALPAAEAA